MTPQDVPGPVVTIEALFPWLAVIAPAAEPGRPRPEADHDAAREALLDAA